ncbi:hypothetical protein X797_011014 [Metarhizium robertsii]|uniref:Uncharacterized protein n=1 Tax=Metarhizium robertsii TaxID=568076 RepID=A0A014P3C1_9HYPO|nr:hypothetical protein X797_011014 [Metarhizium robertsii]
MSALSLVDKIHNFLDFSSVHDALQMARTESKTAVESTMQALDDIKKELKQAANTESTDIGRTVMVMMRDEERRPAQSTEPDMDLCICSGRKWTSC